MGEFRSILDLFRKSGSFSLPISRGQADDGQEIDEERSRSRPQEGTGAPTVRPTEAGFIAHPGLQLGVERGRGEAGRTARALDLRSDRGGPQRVFKGEDSEASAPDLLTDTATEGEKRMIRALLFSILFVAGVVGLDATALPGDCDHSLAKCYGDHPCKACSNCSKCNYCHVKGGYCGVCSKPAKPD